MKNKIAIGIDLDDTLNILIPEWLKRYNKDYNDSLTHDDIKKWEISSYVKEVAKKEIFNYLFDKDLFLNLEVVQNSQEVVKWLSSLSFVEIYIISSAHYRVCEDKGNWLKTNFPMIPASNYIFCHDKYLINVDYLIDDSPYNWIGFKGRYILLDRPHNSPTSYPEIKKNKNIIRAKDWLDIKKILEEELNEVNVERILLSKGNFKKGKLSQNKDWLCNII